MEMALSVPITTKEVQKRFLRQVWILDSSYSRLTGTSLIPIPFNPLTVDKEFSKQEPQRKFLEMEPKEGRTVLNSMEQEFTKVNNEFQNRYQINIKRFTKKT